MVPRQEVIRRSKPSPAVGDDEDFPCVPSARWWLQHPFRVVAGVVTPEQMAVRGSIDGVLEQMEREVAARSISDKRYPSSGQL
jgi:hypothetical protein